MSTSRTQQTRAFWLKHLHQWHWVSAATCLIGLLLFSLTGFMLNHATLIAAKPSVRTAHGEVPAELLAKLQQVATAAEPRTLPAELVQWLGKTLSISPGAEAPEWSEDELYLSLPRPGGDAWLTIDLQQGEVTHEITDRGWIAYLNDLHKGRHTGGAWRLFIDLFAAASLVFALTGLVLLKLQARNRPATWPAIGFGLVLPLLIAILFIH